MRERCNDMINNALKDIMRKSWNVFALFKGETKS